jgi:hypothetical protein
VRKIAKDVIARMNFFNKAKIVAAERQRYKLTPNPK